VPSSADETRSRTRRILDVEAPPALRVPKIFGDERLEFALARRPELVTQLRKVAGLGQHPLEDAAIECLRQPLHAEDGRGLEGGFGCVANESPVFRSDGEARRPPETRPHYQVLEGALALMAHLESLPRPASPKGPMTLANQDNKPRPESHRGRLPE